MRPPAEQGPAWQPAHDEAVPRLAPQAEDHPLLDTLIALARHPRIVLGIPFVSSALALMISFFIPNTYTAAIRILPPRQDQLLAALSMSQMGGLGSLASEGIGLKDPNEVYVAMLKSRGVAEALIRRQDLQKVYKASDMTETVKRLGECTWITSGHDSVITIEVEDYDPARAAALANQYAAELDNLSVSLATNSARQRRVYFEGEVARNRESLSEAESDLRKTEERTGLIDISSQARAILGSVADLRAQITATEVQIQAMRSFATDQNPDLLRLQTRLNALRGQLTAEESGTGKDDLAILPTSKVPGAGLEYMRKLRQVRYYETLYELISRQYELARLQEADSIPAVQILDKAFVPEKKSKPRRSLIVLLVLIVSSCLAVMLALSVEKLLQAGPDSMLASKLRLLRQLLFSQVHLSRGRNAWRPQP